MEERGNLPMIGEPLSRENSSPNSPEKLAAILVELERLAIHYPRTDMDRAKWRELFRTFAGDLARFSVNDVRYGCTHWRQSGERFFPTPGQLIETIRQSGDRPSAIASGRPTRDGGIQPWGGACQCADCRNKTPHEGFYRASPDEYDVAERTKSELELWTEGQLEPSKLDADEMRLRNQLINDLVLNHAMDREMARMKGMVERTKVFYPDNHLAQKATFSERIGVIMTPELVAREEMLGAERMAKLERRLQERHN